MPYNDYATTGNIDKCGRTIGYMHAGFGAQYCMWVTEYGATASTLWFRNDVYVYELNYYKIKYNYSRTYNVYKSRKSITCITRYQKREYPKVCVILQTDVR